MSRLFEVEYRLKKVWERLPVSVRRPLRRVLTRLFFPRHPPAPPRPERAVPGEPLFSPPAGGRGPEPDRLRILVEVPSLDRGGLEEFVGSLVGRMDRARFVPMVVCTESGGEIAERIRQAGIPVAVLGNPRGEYRRLLDEYPIDLLNTHYSDVGLSLAAARGIPVVMVLHNTYTWMGPADRKRLRIQDLFVTRYVAVSAAVQQYAERVFGLPGQKIMCIENGIDLSRHEKLLAAPMGLDRRDLNLSADDFVFLHVAAVDAPKGHNVILAALAELTREHPEVKVLSVGPVRDEIYFQRIRDRVRRWGLETHFQFVGFTPDVHDLYRLSDAFLLPSLIEGYSLSLLEAAFYGLPIIATRVGGAPDFLEGEPFGLLIDPPFDDIASLGVATLTRFAVEERPRHVDQLIRVMREFLTFRDHWKARGRLGREKVLARYDIDRTVSRYESLFLELVRTRLGTNGA